jgi:large subunit ribosomal protein L15
MMIQDITAQVGRKKQRKRIGRGEGSGHGKTAGRGHKGAKSRSGWKSRPYFEGGQMSFVRRMPKRGFSNARFRTEYAVVNLKVLESHVDVGTEVTPASLAAAGIIRDTELPVKILGHGDLTKALNVTAARFSNSARSKIEAAGGTATVDAPRKWTRAIGKSTKKQKETAGEAD